LEPKVILPPFVAVEVLLDVVFLLLLHAANTPGAAARPPAPARTLRAVRRLTLGSECGESDRSGIDVS
jgi:hypothetical protein